MVNYLVFILERKSQQNNVDPEIILKGQLDYVSGNCLLVLLKNALKH